MKAMESFTMEPPVTPPRVTQSSLRQVHRHQQGAVNYASPPKTPMWRSEPPTPTANTSRKRGRDDWTPETPTSLPRRKWDQDAAALSVEWAVGDGHNVAEENSSVGAKIGHAHPVTTGEAVATEDFPVSEKQYIGFAVHWDADVIGVVCPFCMDTEIHLMRRPSNTADADLRVADCDPEKKFQLLLAGDDHPAVKGRSGIWVEEKNRWESVYVEDLCSEQSDQGSEAQKREESPMEEPICSGNQDHGDPMEVLEDTPEDEIIIPGEGVLAFATGTGVDFPIVLSSDDEDEEGPIFSRYQSRIALSSDSEDEESLAEDPTFSGDQEDQEHSDLMEILEDMDEGQTIIPSEEALPLAANTGWDLPIALSGEGEDEEITAEDPICFRYQDDSDPMEISEDMEVDQIIIPSDEALPLAANTGLDLPIARSSNDEYETITDKPTPEENAQILHLAAGLYENPPPEYLTLGHGQVAVVYRPVAVIPVAGIMKKTIGFLDPTASSTRHVFTRSGWKGDEISDADVAWMQGILASTKEAPWLDLSIINNRDYTEKVRKLSAQLGLEPQSHNFDQENPFGQVCFSHVEKQLVVVALEEHQSSKHLTPQTKSLTNRTIYINRAPCMGCLDFAKAVERHFGLRFEFSIMSRVMSEEQARANFRNLDSGRGGDGREVGDSADETPSDNQKPLWSTKARREGAGRYDSEAEYEVLKILDKQKSGRGEAEYLVRWKTTWLTDVQLENQLNGLYAGELDVVREVTRKTGEKRYLVEWEDSWMSVRELGDSKRLIEDYEGGRGLLE